jgi:hypothetical protein
MSDLNKMTKAELVIALSEAQTQVAELQKEVNTLKCEAVADYEPDNIELMLTALKEDGAPDVDNVRIHHSNTRHLPLWKALRVVKNSVFEFTLDKEFYETNGLQARDFNGWLKRQCLSAGWFGGWENGRWKFVRVTERLWEPRQRPNYSETGSSEE